MSESSAYGVSVSQFMLLNILKVNFRLLLGNSMIITHTLCTNLTLLCHICWLVCSLTVTYDWFPISWMNRDGCHMWGRECTLFKDHMISLPLEVWFFHSFIRYTLHNMLVLWLCLRINGLVWLLSYYFITCSNVCFVGNQMATLYSIHSQPMVLFQI